MKAFRRIFSAVSLFFRRVKIRTKAFGRRVISYIDKNPLGSFYLSLGTLLVLIIISNLIGNSKPPTKKEPEVIKDVVEFSIGAVPRINILAKVEKSGVITISALTPGVVKYIKTPVGTKVAKGQNLLGLASNYQGGNSSSLSRALAQTQYQHALDTKEQQLTLVRKQRDIAEKVDKNADQLRDISNESVSETNDLVNLANDILSQLDTSITNLETTNVGGANDALILSTKELKSQFLAVRNQAVQGARMASYNASADNPPAELSDMQKDLTLAQLDIQEKMINLNVEVSRLQLSIARVVEGMMYPAAPMAGRVEQVSVKVGQSVNPGTALMVVSGDTPDQSVKATAYVSENVAGKISMTEESDLRLDNGTTIKVHPEYISQEAVSGSLYGVYFLIPPEHAKETSENSYVTVDIPVGYANTTGSIPFIPIDAVYQTKDTDTVFIDDNGTATSKTVELGDVTGSYVEVTSGLSSGDAVIVSRSVIAGDRVKRVSP